MKEQIHFNYLSKLKLFAQTQVNWTVLWRIYDYFNHVGVEFWPFICHLFKLKFKASRRVFIRVSSQGQVIHPSLLFRPELGLLNQIKIA